ncbi:hypothetical protein BASA60_005891 [Batrachochytrium salamandrivorans]|nr:hypothetical protein BASA60_005891 [Batrachochytrium salamandrivorans]
MVNSVEFLFLFLAKKAHKYVVYDKNDMLKIHEISDGTVSPPHWGDIHPIKSMERYYCRDRPVWIQNCPYEYVMCVNSENDACPDSIQRIFICASSEEETDELLTCFMNMLSEKEEEELYVIDH